MVVQDKNQRHLSPARIRGQLVNGQEGNNLILFGWKEGHVWPLERGLDFTNNIIVN